MVTGIVQAALSVALLVAGLAAFRAVQAHAQDAQATVRFALPGLFCFGALVSARSAIRNLRLGMLERRATSQTPPSPE